MKNGKLKKKYIRAIYKNDLVTMNNMEDKHSWIHFFRPKWKRKAREPVIGWSHPMRVENPLGVVRVSCSV